jgi:hypothetical protein
MQIRMSRIRYSVKPRDAPPAIAARALGLTLDQFSEMLSALLARGFPPHDKTTGNYDLKAIDLWQDGRHGHLFFGDKVPLAPDQAGAGAPIRERLKALAK